jgi:uncharacterized protein RhaS with RHS repeats
MQQRYYDPVAMRFLSVDPVAASPLSFSRYWYANNNPYKNIDPDGRNPVAIVAAGCAASVACVGAAAASAGVVAAEIEAASESVSPTIRAAIIGVQLINGLMKNETASPEAGTSESDEGCIYCVPGEHTSSGKDYVGSTDDLGKRALDKSDGRDRTKAEKIGSYEKGDRIGRQNKEQQAINDRGGKEKLDNKRNEVSEKKWGERGIRPPER